MLQNKITSQDWLQVIGKDKLQAYQDSYALLNGISLIFLDTEGKPLTVWSNAPLFCCEVIKKNGDYCRTSRLEEMARVKLSKEIHIDSCYLGLTNFFIPIYFNNELVAYCVGGGVAENSSCMPEEILDALHVPKLNQGKFRDIAKNLQLSINLLNIDLENVLSKAYGESCEGALDIFEGKLSRREVEVARAICNGMTNKQVAETLFISEKTVKSHVSNILLKLNLRDRVQLVIDYARYNNKGVGERSDTQEAD